jgi:2-aminoadipate transaminase
MQTPWESRYAQRTQRMTSSIIRELLKFTEKPEIISFAGGLPAPDVFPVEAFEVAASRVLRDFGGQALQYGTTEGYQPLREMLARFSSRSGVEVTPENILVTSGSQQALDLLGKVFINPGDHILVEAPTYLGALQAWNAYGAEYVPVPMDEDGMITDALEEALRTGPKFIYVLPNFQNPTGVTLSLERRRQLIALADSYGVPIIEDDPYGQLRYEGEDLPSIVTLDSRYRNQCNNCYQGNVIYLSTFSKTLAPGLRLAWVVAPAQVIGKLVQAKQGADLHTSTFVQMLAYEVARGGFLDHHVQLIREVYGKRRLVMLDAMQAEFPPAVSWTRPKGGLFLWGIMPQGMDAKEVLQVAVARNVAFVPGEAFYPHGDVQNGMRLNFSNASEENIRIGIARLGRVLYEQIESEAAPVGMIR